MRALVLSLSLLCATPALACINDSYVEEEEEQFRSRYEAEAEPEAQPQREDESMVTAGVAGTSLAGLALLGGALLVARRLR